MGVEINSPGWNRIQAVIRWVVCWYTMMGMVIIDGCMVGESGTVWFSVAVAAFCCAGVVLIRSVWPLSAFLLCLVGQCASSRHRAAWGCCCLV